jgi:hypothetical protein
MRGRGGGVGVPYRGGGGGQRPFDNMMHRPNHMGDDFSGGQGFKPIMLKTTTVSCENVSVVLVKREPMVYGCELEVNNLPLPICQNLARNSYHAQLGALTGACICVKGRLISNEEKMNLAMAGSGIDAARRQDNLNGLSRNARFPNAAATAEWWPIAHPHARFWWPAAHVEPIFHV